MVDDFEFTTDWVSSYGENRLTLTADRKIFKILEIDWFEGARHLRNDRPFRQAVATFPVLYR
jgi:hypothetical protein